MTRKTFTHEGTEITIEAEEAWICDAAFGHLKDFLLDAEMSGQPWDLNDAMIEVTKEARGIGVDIRFC